MLKQEKTTENIFHKIWCSLKFCKKISKTSKPLDFPRMVVKCRSASNTFDEKPNQMVFNLTVADLGFPKRDEPLTKIGAPTYHFVNFPLKLKEIGPNEMHLLSVADPGFS